MIHRLWVWVAYSAYMTLHYLSWLAGAVEYRLLQASESILRKANSL